MTKPELALYANADGTGRAYKHPFRKGEDGKPLSSPSVTTVLKQVDKPALIQWAADRTLDWAIENASLLLSKSDEDAFRWGKYRWADVRDERAEVGTGIHETIEMLHTGGWNFPALDEEQQAIMDQWRWLNERYEFTPHRSEFTVWGGMDQEAFDGYTDEATTGFTYAGTGDGLWDILDRKTGQFYSNVVIDLKTSKNTWPEHWLQLAGLMFADVIMEKQPDGTWVEITNEWDKSDGVAIIHLRADKAEVKMETDLELNQLRYKQFQNLVRSWYGGKAVEEYVKNRDKTDALAFR